MLLFQANGWIVVMQDKWFGEVGKILHIKRVLGYLCLPSHLNATFNFTHVSILLYICAAQYLKFDGKIFCPPLYTYNGVCLIHIWHVLIWNPSDTGVKL